MVARRFGTDNEISISEFETDSEAGSEFDCKPSYFNGHDQLNNESNFETNDESDSLSEEELSPSVFSCSYCRLNSPSSLVRCRNCNLWFCNNKMSYYLSHIVCHLVNSNHIAVALHPLSPFGEVSLKCGVGENCDVENIFSLFIIYSPSEIYSEIEDKKEEDKITEIEASKEIKEKEENELEKIDEKKSSTEKKENEQQKDKEETKKTPKFFLLSCQEHLSKADQKLKEILLSYYKKENQSLNNNNNNNKTKEEIKLKDLKGYFKTPVPLISNKQIHPSIVNMVLPIILEKKCLKVTDIQIDALERLWQKGKETSIEDLVRGSIPLKPKKVKMLYKSPEEYWNIFSPLIETEMEYDRRQKSLLNQEDIKIDFFMDRSLGNHSYMARFKLFNTVGGERKRVAESIRSKIKIGDELIIYPQSSSSNLKSNNINKKEKNETKNKKELKMFENGYRGRIISVINRTEILVRLLTSEKPKNTENKTFKIVFNWKKTNFERMIKSIKIFKNRKCSETAIENAILGNLDIVNKINESLSLPENFNSSKNVKNRIKSSTDNEISSIVVNNNINNNNNKEKEENQKHDKNTSKIRKMQPIEIKNPNFPSLNYFQKEALRKAVNSPLTAIQGPPGTGKTTLSANIVYNFALKCLNYNKRMKRQRNMKGRQNKRRGRKPEKERILVCAPSNIAVDHLMEKLVASGINVLRVYAKTKESQISENKIINFVDSKKNSFSSFSNNNNINNNKEKEKEKKKKDYLKFKTNENLTLHILVAKKLLRLLRKEKRFLNSRDFKNFRKKKMPRSRFEKFLILEEMFSLYKKAKAVANSNKFHPTPSLSRYSLSNKKGTKRPTERRKNKITEFADLLSSTTFLPLKKLIIRKEKKILKSAEVICCTCITAGRNCFSAINFPYLLIDECSQSTEPECMIPLLKGARQAVLVGDHYQLGPVVMDRMAAKAGLKQSLFERFVKVGLVPNALKIQYRMHPSIAEYPNRAFYKGFLVNGVQKKERRLPQLSSFWPDEEEPCFFYSVKGREEPSPTGTSYLNREEAQKVVSLVIDILGRGLTVREIGVITPYDAQKQLLLESFRLNSALSDSELAELEVASVDAFQGREKNVIIISCVRSNDYSSVGFLNDYRRLNVAITRAKFGYVVVGNPRLLCTNPLWKSYIGFFELKKLIFEGEVGSLKSVEERFTKFEKAEEIYKGIEELINSRRFDYKPNKVYKNYYSSGSNYFSEDYYRKGGGQSSYKKEFAEGYKMTVSKINEMNVLDEMTAFEESEVGNEYKDENENREEEKRESDRVKERVRERMKKEGKLEDFNFNTETESDFFNVEETENTESQWSTSSVVPSEMEDESYRGISDNEFLGERVLKESENEEDQDFSSEEEEEEGLGRLKIGY